MRVWVRIMGTWVCGWVGEGEGVGVGEGGSESVGVRVWE